jgi:acyl-CoA dehydrogenase
MGELGFLGLKYPEEYGARVVTTHDAVFTEEMARCGSGGVAAGRPVAIASPPIYVWH